MIFITGDTHGHFDVEKIFSFYQNFSGKKLTKDDYLIIAGDFGFVWDEQYDKDIEKLGEFDLTFLFVDGNHENFDIISNMPVTEWHGGKVHRFSDNVIHLMRGQVFEIDGNRIFTFGGAESVDKDGREEGISWWPSEVPTEAEFEEAKANLGRVGNTVDYIITHTINTSALTHKESPMSMYRYEPTATTDMLEYFEHTVAYKVWFFGHYHFDAPIASNKVGLYNQIVKINSGDTN